MSVHSVYDRRVYENFKTNRPDRIPTFLSRFNYSDPLKCWIWTGTTTKGCIRGNYQCFHKSIDKALHGTNPDGSIRISHFQNGFPIFFSFPLFTGILPDPLEDLKCDCGNPLCQNPTHYSLPNQHFVLNSIISPGFIKYCKTLSYDTKDGKIYQLDPVSKQLIEQDIWTIEFHFGI